MEKRKKNVKKKTGIQNPKEFKLIYRISEPEIENGKQKSDI